MRISDWSSDVCASDLLLLRRVEQIGGVRHAAGKRRKLRRGQCRRTPQAKQQGRRDGPDAGHQNSTFGACSAPGEVAWKGTIGFAPRSEEHTSELQSLMRISYAVFCLKTKQARQSTQQHYMP